MESPADQVGSSSHIHRAAIYTCLCALYLTNDNIPALKKTTPQECVCVISVHSYQT